MSDETKNTAWEFLLKVALIVLVPIVALIAFLVSSVYNLRTEVETMKTRVLFIEKTMRINTP